jgi:hypothetical protein
VVNFGLKPQQHDFNFKKSQFFYFFTNLNIFAGPRYSDGPCGDQGGDIFAGPRYSDGPCGDQGGADGNRRATGADDDDDQRWQHVDGGEGGVVGDGRAGQRIAQGGDGEEGCHADCKSFLG